MGHSAVVVVVVVVAAELEVVAAAVVGFTLSQATKDLRESRGIALLYFRPLH